MAITETSGVLKEKLSHKFFFTWCQLREGHLLPADTHSVAVGSWRRLDSCESAGEHVSSPPAGRRQRCPGNTALPAAPGALGVRSGRETPRVTVVRSRRDASGASENNSVASLFSALMSPLPSVLFHIPRQRSRFLQSLLFAAASRLQNTLTQNRLFLPWTVFSSCSSLGIYAAWC